MQQYTNQLYFLYISNSFIYAPTARFGSLDIAKYKTVRQKKNVKIQGNSYIFDVAELLSHPPMLRKRGLN